MHEYIRSIKGIFDALLASGQSLIEDDLINCIINGLEPEYDPMVVQILSKWILWLEKWI